MDAAAMGRGRRAAVKRSTAAPSGFCWRPLYGCCSVTMVDVRWWAVARYVCRSIDAVRRRIADGGWARVTRRLNGSGRGFGRRTTASAAPATAGAVTAAPTANGGTIKGTVKAGAVPLPGVSVTATNTLTGKKYATTTDVTGAFAMAVPRNGRYVVRAELAAFAPQTKEVLINAAGENGGKPEQVAEFGIATGFAGGSSRRSSRRRRLDAAQAPARAGARDAVAECDGGCAGLGGCECRRGKCGCADADTGRSGWRDAAATDSVTVSGQMGQTNGLANFSEDEIRQRVQDAVAQAQRQGGAAGDMANAVVGMLGGMMGGGWVWRAGWRWGWWRSRRTGRWRRGWWRVPKVQSYAAAWSDFLSGRQRGAGCRDLFVDGRAGGEAVMIARTGLG